MPRVRVIGKKFVYEWRRWQWFQKIQGIKASLTRPFNWMRFFAHSPIFSFLWMLVGKSLIIGPVKTPPYIYLLMKFMGQKIQDILPSEIGAKFIRALHESIKTGKVVSIEYQLKSA